MRQVTNDDATKLYRQAFNQVCDETNWRGPVDCIVPWELANLYMQAIEFMTGVRPEAVTYHDAPYRAMRLTCIGYSAGPCG